MGLLILLYKLCPESFSLPRPLFSSSERLQRKYGDLGGQVEIIEFSRGKTGIGLSLAGNKDRSIMSVFVAGIQPDSPAARDGRIRVGDELLEVSGEMLQSGERPVIV